MQCTIEPTKKSKTTKQEYRMCTTCKVRHYYTAFCDCGQCLYNPMIVSNEDIGTVIVCHCGIVRIGHDE